MTKAQQFRRELPGGTILVGETDPHRRSLALGVWVGTGSRDEAQGLEGMAHFVEHLVFKGTANRSAREITSALERVGGSLEAFTTKESTCFYARVLEEDQALAADVVCDLVGRPRFDPEDIDRERQVIVEEIRGLDDNPEELVGDLAMAQLWPNHGLGNSILGTEESLLSMDADTVRTFHEPRYAGSGITVAAAGAIDPDRLTEELSRHLERRTAGAAPSRTAPTPAAPGRSVHEKDTAQAHLSVAMPAPAHDDLDRPAVQVLAELFGGGMSSRLFQSVREEAGLAYSVYAYSEHFDHAGIFGAVLSVSPERAEEALERTRHEMRRLRRDGLQDGELAAALAQVRGSLVMGQESLSNRMLRMARLEREGRGFESLETTLERFLRVTEADVLAVAERVLDPDALRITAVGPVPHLAEDQPVWSAHE